MTSGILFLDRDGVLNEKAPEGQYIDAVAKLRLIDAAAESIGVLRQALPDLRVAIVSNQRGVARGHLSLADADRINERLLAQLAARGGIIDRVEICPHEAGRCDCRKPGTGMLERVLRAWPERSAAASAMVGDSASDVIAAARLSVRAYLVGDESRRLAQAAAATDAGFPPDGQAGSLAELAADGRLLRWLRDGAP